MRNEFTSVVRTVLGVWCLMLLASCGQTGELVLPGTQPGAQTEVQESDADEEDDASNE